MLKQFTRDSIAKFLAICMKHFAFDSRYFDLWQSHGFHVKQVSFYSPIPETSRIPTGVFTTESELPGIDMNDRTQSELLVEFTNMYRTEYEALQSTSPDSRTEFAFNNTSFESVDAETLYCMIRKHKPKRFVEIGSGHSTLIATVAMAKNEQEGEGGTLTAIEPYPPSFLRESLAFPIELKTEFVQAVSIDFFTSLNRNDILFIDSSHVCKTGSDVHYEFLEILPRLAPGVVVHVHDIFLPMDYPQTWVVDLHRFWNEQYLLQAFLCGNGDFEVLWAAAWMHRFHSAKLAEAFSSYDSEATLPASFWIMRR